MAKLKKDPDGIGPVYVGDVWAAWRDLTVKMIRAEFAAIEPFMRDRQDDAEAYLDNVLSVIREAHAATARIARGHGSPQ